MSEHMNPIPSRIYNAAVGGHVCGPEDVDFGQKVVHLIKYDRAGNEVSFESQVIQANKIYVIHDDFTLSSNVTIPANCILEFDGGSIRGEYTLSGTNTGINAGLVKIFNTDIILAGTWNVTEVYPEWFGAKGDGVTDDRIAFQSAINVRSINSRLFLNDKIYYISDSLTVSFDLYIEGNGSTLSTDHNIAQNYNPLFNLSAPITIKNLNAVNTTDDTINSGTPFCECNGNKIVIDNCNITGFCTAVGQIGDYSVVTNNKIVLSTVKDEAANSFYGIHGQYSHGYICHNYIKNGRHHIYISGECEDITVDSNYCDDSYWQNIHVFTYGIGSKNINISRNKVSNNGNYHAIIVSGTHNDILISENILDKGIMCQASNANNVQNIIICNNIINAGIVLDRINGVKVYNNTIKNIDYHLNVYNGTKNITVYGNVFRCDNSTKIVVGFNGGSDISMFNNHFKVMNNDWMTRNDSDGVLVGLIKVMNNPIIIAKNNIYNEWVVNMDIYYQDSLAYYSPHKIIRVQNENVSLPRIQWYEGDEIICTSSENYVLKRVIVADVTDTPVCKAIALS